jgi:hypothetical protein
MLFCPHGADMGLMFYWVWQVHGQLLHFNMHDCNQHWLRYTATSPALNWVVHALTLPSAHIKNTQGLILTMQIFDFKMKISTLILELIPKIECFTA